MRAPCVDRCSYERYPKAIFMSTALQAVSVKETVSVQLWARRLLSMAIWRRAA
eukprot:IDg11509t1